ncbi:MAG: hypothetical protein NTZ79_04585, partial [Proteobacteria bacterium]|nr:hypothetical protein [Pseudomonadota bacterium]
LIETGTNWFKCPEGHFWYWAPDPASGPAPFLRGTDVLTIPQHAPVPTDIDEAKRFVRVIVFENDTDFYWTGEWVASFPEYIELDEADLVAWHTWLGEPQRIKFFEETLSKCRELSIKARSAQGYVQFNSTSEQDADGLVRGTVNPG